MGKVMMHNVVSVDGYIADENDDVGPLFDWYFNGDQPITDELGEAQHAPFRVSAASAEYTRSFWQSIGATIMGRHLFDLTNGWDANPPAGEHLIVVSHRPKPDGWHPEADVDVVAGWEGTTRALDEIRTAGPELAASWRPLAGAFLALTRARGRVAR